MNEALTAAMTLLSEQPHVLFLGQSVYFPGTSMHASFNGVPAHQKIELPVAEQLQLGISIGLSLEGFLPVSIFPRWNFLLSATDMLINHLDRLPLYSGYEPKVIIRTAVGHSKPLDPGPQHQDDCTDAFRLMLRTVYINKINRPDQVVPAYQRALDSRLSTLLVEDLGS